MEKKFRRFSPWLLKSQVHAFCQNSQLKRLQLCCEACGAGLVTLQRLSSAENSETTPIPGPYGAYLFRAPYYDFLI